MFLAEIRRRLQEQPELQSVLGGKNTAAEVRQQALRHRRASPDVRL